MTKVTITGHKTRTMATDHKSVSPIHKPASKEKPGVGGYSYSHKVSNAQDKKYNTLQM